MNYKRLQRNLIQLNSVDSTNNFAAKLIKSQKVENGTTILTKRQTEGKGQRGKVWQSGANLNLLCSIILYPEIKVEKAFYLNIITSLALRSCIDRYEKEQDSWIKWPNDLLIGSKKVAGILIENQIQGDQLMSSIVGVGVNLNQTDFGPELRATSLRKVCGLEVNIEDFLGNLLDQLDREYHRLMSAELEYLVMDYVESLYGKDSTLEFKDAKGSLQGRIQGIDQIGRLKILVDQEIRTYQMGEIEFIY